MSPRGRSPCGHEETPWLNAGGSFTVSAVFQSGSWAGRCRGTRASSGSSRVRRGGHLPAPPIPVGARTATVWNGSPSVPDSHDSRTPFKAPGVPWRAAIAYFAICAAPVFRSKVSGSAGSRHRAVRGGQSARATRSKTERSRTIPAGPSAQADFGAWCWHYFH